MNNALIFDCDGVLADTERYGHLPAFNQTFQKYGLPVHWSEEEYAEKLKIGGGKERMASLLTPEFCTSAGLAQEASALNSYLSTWHHEKTEIFKQFIRAGRLPGRPGIRRISQEAFALGWKLAVASTSAEELVRGVLEHVVGPELAGHFLVLAGDVVPHKKPAPDIYLLALKELHLSSQQAIVIEDLRNGLLAANAAGLQCVITMSSYTVEEDFSEACLVVSDLGEPDAPMRLAANRSPITPGAWLTCHDLAGLLE